MKQVLHRALPFVMAFIFGVACTAIVRSFLPTRQKAFNDNGRTRCKWKAKKNEAPPRVIAVQGGSTAIDITEIEESGSVRHIPFRLAESYSDRLNLKEQALWFRALQEQGISSPGLVVSYVPPDAIDGAPVDSNAILINIPRPRFWREHHQRAGREVDCDAIVRVDLHASGRVSDAKLVQGHAERCSHTGDILDAAKQISFRSAFRDGVPVSQRMSIMYRSH